MSFKMHFCPQKYVWSFSFNNFRCCIVIVSLLFYFIFLTYACLTEFLWFNRHQQEKSSCDNVISDNWLRQLIMTKGLNHIMLFTSPLK